MVTTWNTGYLILYLWVTSELLFGKIPNFYKWQTLLEGFKKPFSMEFAAIALTIKEWRDPNKIVTKSYCRTLILKWNYLFSMCLRFQVLSRYSFLSYLSDLENNAVFFISPGFLFECCNNLAFIFTTCHSRTYTYMHQNIDWLAIGTI